MERKGARKRAKRRRQAWGRRREHRAALAFFKGRGPRPRWMEELRGRFWMHVRSIEWSDEEIPIPLPAIQTAPSDTHWLERRP